MLPVFFISMNVVRISNKINVIQILPCTSSAFKYFHICSTDKNFTVQLHTCGAGLLYFHKVTDSGGRAAMLAALNCCKGFEFTVT